MKKKIYIVLSLLAFAVGSAVGLDQPIWLFSGTQGFAGAWEDRSLATLNLSHTLFGGAEFRDGPHTLGLWIQDSLAIDFAGLEDDVEFPRLLNNTVSLGLDNTWFYKNAVYYQANVYGSLGLPNNQYRVPGFTAGDDQPFAVAAVFLRVGGRYWYGFDWAAGFELPVKAVFNMWDLSTLKPTGSVNVSYEFFRHQGPRELKLTLSFSDSLTGSLPLVSLFGEDEDEDGGTLGYTLLNALSAGIVFTWLPVSLSIGFTDNFSYNLSTESLASHDIGLYAGAALTVGRFLFNLRYTGYWHAAAGAGAWLSSLGFSWTINLSTYDETVPAVKPATDR